MVKNNFIEKCCLKKQFLTLFILRMLFLNITLWYKIVLKQNKLKTYDYESNRHQKLLR
jgi:hypothetical protein